MREVRIVYDRGGQTLTVWLEDSSREYICEETSGEVVLMKDSAGRIIGLVLDSDLFRVAFETAPA